MGCSPLEGPQEPEANPISPGNQLWDLQQIIVQRPGLQVQENGARNTCLRVAERLTGFREYGRGQLQGWYAEGDQQTLRLPQSRSPHLLSNKAPVLLNG